MKNIVAQIYEGLEFTDTLDTYIKLLEYIDKHCKSFTSELLQVTEMKFPVNTIQNVSVNWGE